RRRGARRQEHQGTRARVRARDLRRARPGKGAGEDRQGHRSPQRGWLHSWRSVEMNDSTTREPASDPQDLERLLVARENGGEVTGMTALFEPDAVVDIGGGTFLRGKEAIHEFFTKLQVTGFGPEKRKFEFGEQRPALICGDLALTSTRSRDGNVTSEV